MPEASPLTPESRRRKRLDRLNESIPLRLKHIVERVAVGVYTDGFTFAGNFAYLALVAVFAFFIVAAAIAGSLGATEAGRDFVEAFLRTVPYSVAEALREPIESAMGARTGMLLWFSAAVGLWTTTSLIETIREILHRAYGVEAQRPFWEYRLTSIVMIVVAVFLTMLALSAQFLFAAMREFLTEAMPQMEAARTLLSITSLLPFLMLFGTLYLVFRILTPRTYRARRFPKWPGAVFISLWWLGIVGLLPLFLKYASNYQLTYGSLAGVMITLIFFYLVGLGMVIGAQLNASLAESPAEG